MFKLKKDYTEYEYTTMNLVWIVCLYTNEVVNSILTFK